MTNKRSQSSPAPPVDTPLHAHDTARLNSPEVSSRFREVSQRLLDDAKFRQRVLKKAGLMVDGALVRMDE